MRHCGHLQRTSGASITVVLQPSFQAALLCSISLGPQTCMADFNKQGEPPCWSLRISLCGHHPLRCSHPCAQPVFTNSAKTPVSFSFGRARQPSRLWPYKEKYGGFQHNGHPQSRNSKSAAIIWSTRSRFPSTSRVHVTTAAPPFKKENFSGPLALQHPIYSTADNRVYYQKN